MCRIEHPIDFPAAKCYQGQSMKMKSLKILSAITIALFVLGTTLYAQGTDSRIGSISREHGHEAIQAQQITKAEAEKKYPSHGGGYPTGQRDPHEPSGIVVSPYPPHERYDCSKVAHGALVVDTKANKVFVRP
jgi:hypothetical protein